MPMNRMMIASVLRAASLLSACASTPTQAVSSAATNYLDAYSTWAYAKQAFDQWAAQFRTRLAQINGR